MINRDDQSYMGTSQQDHLHHIHSITTKKDLSLATISQKTRDAEPTLAQSCNSVTDAVTRFSQRWLSVSGLLSVAREKVLKDTDPFEMRILLPESNNINGSP